MADLLGGDTAGSSGSVRESERLQDLIGDSVGAEPVEGLVELVAESGVSLAEGEGAAAELALVGKGLGGLESVECVGLGKAGEGDGAEGAGIDPAGLKIGEQVVGVIDSNDLCFGYS